MNYQEAVSHLEPIRDARDLNALEKTAGELEQELRQTGEEDYPRIMLYVCNLLSTYNFQDFERQTRLLHQYADATLKNAPSIPLELELQLLTHLGEDFEDPDAQNDIQRWASKRRVRTERWLKTLQRLDDEIQKDFNFADLPLINIAPPVTDLPAGVAPEAIEDPAMRKVYEAALEENRLKAETFARQWDLRELHNRYSPVGIQHISRAYARPPFDEAELQGLLNEHLSDGDSKAAILNADRGESTTESE